MKIRKVAIALLIVLVVCLCSSVIYSKAQQYDRESSLEDQINTLQESLANYASLVGTDNHGETEAIIQKLTELSRENEILREENLDLKTQMEQLGWWKE